MKQDDFEDYKKAVKQYYEKEKEGNFSSFLLQPSRANLRKLCVERFKENTNLDDLNTFAIFMGFEFKPEHRNRLKESTDRFRTIENFLKGTTDSNDLETINLTAILVDFPSRPFLKFVKYQNGQKYVPTDFKLGEEVNKHETIQPKQIEKRTSKRNKLILGLLGFIALFSIGYTAKSLVLPQKECMQWQVDRYVEVDCQSANSNFYSSSSVIPYEESTSKLKKLTVTDTTTFFNGDKAIIWYSKVNGYPEFFNGPGFHPLTGKGLRPVSEYIIEKYVKNASNPNTTP